MKQIRLFLGLMVLLPFGVMGQTCPPSVSTAVVGQQGCDRTLTLTTVGNLPAGTAVNWYASGQQGAAPVAANFIGTTATTTTCPTVCPDLLAVFINACNGTGVEEDNEYIVFSSGGGFNTNSLAVDLPNNGFGAGNADIQTGATPCGIQTPTAGLMASLQAGACTAANVLAAGPGTLVPSGAIVILFTNNNVTTTYDLSTLCSNGQTIYVMQSACDRNAGAFVNSDVCSGDPLVRLRHTSVSINGCSCVDTLTYSRCNIPNTDGLYAFDNGQDTSSVSNGGVLVNPVNPCNGPNFSAIGTGADTLVLTYSIPASWCGETMYVTGELANQLGCLTQEFPVSVVCPAPQITAPPYVCAGGTTLTISNPLGAPFWVRPDGVAINGTTVNATMAGIYTANITDAAGCVYSDTVNMVMSGLGTESLQTVCNLEGTLYNATLTIGGGVLPYTVNGTALTVNSYTVNNIAVGTSPVWVVSDAYCSVSVPIDADCSAPAPCDGLGCFGDNLLVNGGFEQGNTGFSSNYEYWDCSSTTSLCNLPDGSPFLCEYDYGISTNASNCIASWSPNVTGHATGTDNFMMVNYPAGNVGGQNRFWCQVVNLSPATDYCFGGYFINLVPTSADYPLPSVGFEIGGSILGNSFEVQDNEQWGWQGVTFNSGAGGDVAFCLVNANFGVAGYDVGIDDLSLRPVAAGSAPVAVADAVEMGCLDYSVTINVLGNDTNLGANAVVTLDETPPFSVGTVSVNADNTILFVPAATPFTGSATFSYKVCNGNCCTVGQVTIVAGTVILNTSNVQNATCAGACNGSAEVNLNLNSSFGYQWANGSGATGAGQAVGDSLALGGLCAGVYTVTVTLPSQFSIFDIYSEGFENGANGWTLDVPTGANDANPNHWAIDDSESGVAPTNCGEAGNGDETLHVTCQGLVCNLIGSGAIYNATLTSNYRAESPAFSTVGANEAILTFDYIANGEGMEDNASLWYNDGSGWTVLVPSLKTSVCSSGQGRWSDISIALPASCLNNANVRLAFNWTNNNDNQGSDPSFAVNNIKVTGNLWSGVGCSATTTFTITEPAPLTATIAVTNASCGANDGVCIATPFIPLGDYYYVWSTGQTTAAASGLGVGCYTVTVIDSNGCTTIASACVTNTGSLTAAITGNTTVCVGSTTTLTATGGSSYQWSGSAGNANIAIVGAGTYTVTATSGACSGTTSVTVTNTPLPTVNISGVTNICAGGSTMLTATGGSSYAWSTGDNVSMITVSPNVNTIYTVTVTAGNCSNTGTVSVNVSAPPTISITGETTICDRTSTTLTASGGDLYFWSNASGEASTIVFPMATQTYTVTVTTNGCSNTQSVTVVVRPLPVVSFTGNTSICAGSSTDLTAIGGTSYQWSSGATTAINTVSPTANTIYTVTVTANGCDTVSTIGVNVIPAPIITLSGRLQVCGNGITTITAGGGDTYQWSGGLGNSPVITTGVGDYTVTVSNSATGCFSTFGFTVSSLPLPVAAIDGIFNTCGNATTTLTASGGFDYLWSGGNGNTATINVGAGNYTVTVTNPISNCSSTSAVTVIATSLPIVTVSGNTTVCEGGTTTLTASGADFYEWSRNLETTAAITVGAGNYVVIGTSNGCSVAVNTVVTAGATPSPNAGADVTITEGGSVQLTASPLPTIEDSYSWSPAGSLNNANVYNPIASPTETTTYTVTLTNDIGCSGTDVVTVFVTKELSCLAIHEGITPNNDGHNDEWAIPCLYGFVNELEIYNRWGELLYSVKNYDGKWNGEYDGKSLPDGTYYYVVRILDGNNAVKNVRKGTVSVVR